MPSYLLRCCGFFSKKATHTATLEKVDENKISEIFLSTDRELGECNNLFTQFKKIVSIVMKQQNLDLRDDATKYKTTYSKLKSHHKSLILINQECYTLQFQQEVERLDASVMNLKNDLNKDVTYYNKTFQTDKITAAEKDMPKIPFEVLLAKSSAKTIHVKPKKVKKVELNRGKKENKLECIEEETSEQIRGFSQI
jgi:hypothetical protein